jgi:cbb3-type cytochrome oxidase subunit 3
MDIEVVLERFGFAAACVVVMGGFVAGIVWWVLNAKSKSDDSAQESAKESARLAQESAKEINKTLLDLSVRTIEKVGASVEKVGDNIEKQTGHMVALTESTQRIESQVRDHGRILGEHRDHLEEIRKSLGARQA